MGDRMLTVNVEPGIVKKWLQFKNEKAPFSIALDGYVYGRPQVDVSGPWANYNHHEETDGLNTRATCGQIYLAIKQRFFELFKKNGQNHVNIYANDCDQDVAHSIWLLKNPVRIDEPLILELTRMEDMMDVTSGSFPVNSDNKLLMKMAWIFEPYTNARTSGKLENMNGSQMEEVVNEICDRITAFADKKGEQRQLDTSYELIENGHGFIVIKETGPYSRYKIFGEEGHSAFVTVKELGDGSYKYTFARLSEYVNFPLAKFYDVLNQIEKLSSLFSDEMGKINCWGGSLINGGSPRFSGSKIKPVEMARLLNAIIDNKNVDDEIAQLTKIVATRQSILVIPKLVVSQTQLVT